MKNIILFIALTIILNGCKSIQTTVSTYESETLKIERISNNVFQHTSYLKTRSFGDVPCNGMIYFNENEAIIFDTPTNREASHELIKWIGNKKIKAVIATHFHIDCLGGLEEFHLKNIDSYANYQTIALAKEHNKTLPKFGFNHEKEFKIGKQKVLAKYFGEGHTKDNIIGYVPNEKVLFGGCLVKEVNATKGNLADATPSEWSKTIRKLKQALPEIDFVIPGHGKNGGTELLDYTIQLFEK